MLVQRVHFSSFLSIKMSGRDHDYIVDFAANNLKNLSLSNFMYPIELIYNMYLI